MIFKYSHVLITTFIAAATAATNNVDKAIPNKEGESSSTLSPRTLRSTQVVDAEEKDINVNAMHPSDVLATIADDNDTLHSVGGSKMGLRRLKNVFDPDTKSSKGKIHKRNKADKCKDSSYILAPYCDWSQGETFIYDGNNGECIVPPSAHKERPLWYSLEEGTCNVLQVNSTHLEFDVHRTETGILFSSVPHKYVLDPEESDKFSDLSLFKDKAVSILIKGGDIGEILFVGVLDMTAEGNGLITGKKIHGELDLTHDSSTTYSFVLGSVDRVRAWSAVGLGMCSSDGQGRVSIEVDDFVSFKEDRIDPGFPMKFFENVNVAIFSENLGYEVFTIDKVDTDYWTPESPHTGSIEGSTYFSTRIGAWDTQFRTREMFHLC